MIEIETSIVKKKELEILKAFHQFCEENNLKYFLGGGTLIGAVRHKGFIPWDDDIDIAMLRDDYMRLIEIFPANGINGCQLLSPYTDMECPITFAKLYDTSTVKKDKEVIKKYWKYGIDIDIFPWDGVPEEKERKQFFRKQYFDFHIFLAIVGRYRKEKSLGKTIGKGMFMTLCKGLAFLRILNAQKINLKMNELAMQYKVKDSEMICDSVFPDCGGMRKMVTKDAFSQQINLEFEDGIFFGPIGYDEYLTNAYGDYMKLPPKEEQKTHHLSNIYYKN